MGLKARRESYMDFIQGKIKCYHFIQDLDGNLSQVETGLTDVSFVDNKEYRNLVQQLL